jgi:hypothetical protein
MSTDSSLDYNHDGYCAVSHAEGNNICVLEVITEQKTINVIVLVASATTGKQTDTCVFCSNRIKKNRLIQGSVRRSTNQRVFKCMSTLY